jgi:hypothetical protein
MTTRNPITRPSVAERAKIVVATTVACSVVSIASFLGIRANATDVTPPTAAPALTVPAPPTEVIVKVVYVTVPSTQSTAGAPVVAATAPPATTVAPRSIPVARAVPAPPKAVRPSPALTSKTSGH